MKKHLAMVSLLTITGLYGLLAAIVILISYLTEGTALPGIYISIVILIIQFLISPWVTDLTMKWFYDAKFSYEVPEYLDSFINQICEKYNMKHPKIGFIDDGAPNAFTYGRFRNDARIIITRGVTDLLSEEEVISVVGHELGHVVHRDMLVMTAVQVVPLVLYGIFEICMDAALDDDKSSSSSSSDSNSGNAKLGFAAIGAIAYVLYIICQLVILWLSRTREYYADEFSCKETKNPSSLASALVTIGYGLATTGKTETENKHSVTTPNPLGIADGKTSKELAICCVGGDTEAVRSDIQNAMKWDMWNTWAKVYEILSTHPLIAKRILAISDYCPEYGQERYITFDLEKPKGVVGNFARDLLIDSIPSFAFLAAAVLALVFSANNPEFLPLYFIIPWVLLLVKFLYKHPLKGMDERHSVRELLGVVDVSGITPVPCEVKGKIIGRGNPGCVFNEDFVIKDSTGIMMLDYNQPIGVLNKIFALFKSPDYFDKTVTVNGWYRRAPVPYVEIKTFEVDGKVKKVWTYGFGKFGIISMIILHILLFIVFYV